MHGLAFIYKVIDNTLQFGGLKKRKQKTSTVFLGVVYVAAYFSNIENCTRMTATRKSTLQHALFNLEPKNKCNFCSKIYTLELAALKPKPSWIPQVHPFVVLSEMRDDL